ncbi:unnamed protein product (macronuclear) [Paramecium tetraurelia]|uniref:Transmembrane protein n=1 Tax=Paramecium tetraurelia TaxID=5888 RepID=A0DVF2_PARTE|nr:uncharacterized protein GSPATT00020683001 [Paramecium tetraurelia]CAK87019.1 unnamed protein product [Paramecium tetraurelia]|eukprot:XP_001454416.1 hypothetical protein (macronuclear) [Paramecium tetraurelia strain d4-2]
MEQVSASFYYTFQSNIKFAQQLFGIFHLIHQKKVERYGTNCILFLFLHQYNQHLLIYKQKSFMYDTQLMFLQKIKMIQITQFINTELQITIYAINDPIIFRQPQINFNYIRLIKEINSSYKTSDLLRKIRKPMKQNETFQDQSVYHLVNNTILCLLHILIQFIQLNSELCDLQLLIQPNKSMLAQLIHKCIYLKLHISLH